MSQFFDKQHQPNHTELNSARNVMVLPIDEAVCGHMSQAYWDWRALFDRDPQASPLQHADFVLAELATTRMASRLAPTLVRDGSASDPRGLGILVPKTIRSSQVGGVGPSWTLQGLRLAGGRFLGVDVSLSDQIRMLGAVVRHIAESGADFLLIEDLDEATSLFHAVKEQTTNGCQLFISHEFQPRHYIDFPQTAADYWGTFSSRSLSKFRRNLKKFGRTELVRVTEVTQIPDFLRAAHEISQQSWQSRNFGLRIRNDDAEFRQMSALSEQRLLRSYLWLIEDKPAAFAICNQHGGCFRYEEIAYCAEFGQFSPGRTMLQQIVEDLLQHDPPQYLDFGGGDAEYKQQFANRQSRSGTVWLVPPTWRARWALSYLKACRRLRSAGRTFIRSAGLATRARQWLRSQGAFAKAVSTHESNDVVTASESSNH